MVGSGFEDVRILEGQLADGGTEAFIVGRDEGTYTLSPVQAPFVGI